MSAVIVQDVPCVSCTSGNQCAGCAAATLEKRYYCHCDGCGVLPLSKRIVDQQKYKAHIKNGKFEGMRYAKWRQTYSKYMACKQQ